MTILYSRIILHEEPDDDAPERHDHESWYEYGLRWWFYWSTQAAERKREGYKATMGSLK
jgi:hypothetical protein